MFPPCNPHQRTASGPPSLGQGHLAQVLGPELHPVQRTSSDELHFLYHPWAPSVQKTKKTKQKSILNGQVAQPGVPCEIC